MFNDTNHQQEHYATTHTVEEIDIDEVGSGSVRLELRHR